MLANVLLSIVQRLFSTFADGWPGAGLLIQRFLIGAILSHGVFLQLSAGSHFTTVVLPLFASAFLVMGLGTPYIGLLVAVAELWLWFSGSADPWTAIIVCGLGLSLAMIGPGAWSMDARFFGRKHVEIVRK
jgi:putative oxidoreductase